MGHFTRLQQLIATTQGCCCCIRSARGCNLHDGGALKFAADKIKEDKEVVVAAVKNVGTREAHAKSCRFEDSMVQQQSSEVGKDKHCSKTVGRRPNGHLGDVDPKAKRLKHGVDNETCTWIEEQRASLEQRLQASLLDNDSILPLTLEGIPALGDVQGGSPRLFIYSDVDGTLFPGPSSPIMNAWNKGSLVAMRALRDLGVDVIMNTGNTLGMLGSRMCGHEELVSDSGVFAGGADPIYEGQPLAHPEQEWFSSTQVEFTRTAQAQNSGALFVWMSRRQYFMDLEVAKKVRNSIGGIERNVWDDAKDYLSANLGNCPAEKQACIEKFQLQVRDLAQYSTLLSSEREACKEKMEANPASSDLQVQVLYIKGLGFEDTYNASLAVNLAESLGMTAEQAQQFCRVPRQKACQTLPTQGLEVLLMCTQGRWEMSVTRLGVDKKYGSAKLEQHIRKERVILVAGDSGNDASMRDAVVDGTFPNAVFIATADASGQLSRMITGDAPKEQSLLGVTAQAGAQGKVHAGLPFQVLELLVEHLGKARASKTLE